MKNKQRPQTYCGESESQMSLCGQIQLTVSMEEQLKYPPIICHIKTGSQTHTTNHEEV